MRPIDTDISPRWARLRRIEVKTWPVLAFGVLPEVDQCLDMGEMNSGLLTEGKMAGKDDKKRTSCRAQSTEPDSTGWNQVWKER